MRKVRTRDHDHYPKSLEISLFFIFVSCLYAFSAKITYKSKLIFRKNLENGKSKTQEFQLTLGKKGEHGSVWPRYLTDGES